MPSNPISRRDILRTLAMGAAGGSVLRVIPLQAAEQAHKMVRKEKQQAPAGKYQPKFFSAHLYATLHALCEAIIPSDERSGGAVQAGAPEFIDLITSESKELQRTLGGGLLWLDSECTDRYANTFLACDSAQQREFLDLIAYRKNVIKNPRLSHGVEFFAFLRRLTTDAFYSSEIGIKDLEYIGNTFVEGDFPGCPPVPET